VTGPELVSPIFVYIERKKEILYYYNIGKRSDSCILAHFEILLSFLSSGVASPAFYLREATMTTQQINITLIDLPRTLLRDIGDVERDWEHFKALRDSIASEGLLHPITVRPNGGRYELVAGAHRLACCRDLGHMVIDAQVRDLSDSDAIAIRIMENAARLEATPVQFARHLYLLMQAEPDLKQADIARRVGRSSGWVANMLKLTSLVPSAQKALDRGQMPVSNGFELAKIAKKDQEQYVQDAIMMKVTDFKAYLMPIMRAQQFAYTRRGEEKRTAKQEGLHPFVKHLHLILNEIKLKQAGAALIAQCKATNPLDVWVLALRWVTHTDPITQRERQAALEKQAEEDEPIFDSVMIERRR
jgi:ParB/RepB/Spo0J family partition protein